MILSHFHYENTPLQYTYFFFSCKNLNFHQKNFDIFLIFAQNIDCGYTEAVLTSTHNVCFGSNMRKNIYPGKSQFFFIKVGFTAVYISPTCFHDGKPEKCPYFLVVMVM